MGVFQDELVPTLVEIGMSAEEEESPSSREDGASGPLNDWDMAERSRITQIAAGSYHSLALGGSNPVSPPIDFFKKKYFLFKKLGRFYCITSFKRQALNSLLWWRVVTTGDGTVWSWGFNACILLHNSIFRTLFVLIPECIHG
jgi:alpha-tubulin suppressor-like RCC1 family protein